MLILEGLRKTFQQEKLSRSWSWKELRTGREGMWIREPLFKGATLGKSLSLICGMRMIMTLSATWGALISQ